MFIGNNNLKMLDNLEKNVYPFVAHKYQTTVANIKTNIVKATKAIEKEEFYLYPKDIITEIVNVYAA